MTRTWRYLASEISSSKGESSTSSLYWWDWWWDFAPFGPERAACDVR